MMYFRLFTSMTLVFAAGFCGTAGAAGHRYSVITDDGAEGAPALDLAGPVLVFYGAPGCAACEAALKDLSGVPAYGAALLTRTFYLTARENLAKAAEWNAAGPYEYSVMYSTADWPELNGASLPAISFYSGGVQVCRLEGWHGTGAAVGFGDCLRKTGLLAAGARLESAADATRLPPGADSLAEAGKKASAAEYAALLNEGAFSSAALAGYEDGIVKAAYRLADDVSFYSSCVESVDVQSAALAELARRGLVNENKVQELHQRMLDAKLFSRAAALKAQYPSFELPAVPPMSGSLETKPGEIAVYYTKDGLTGMEIQKVQRGSTRIIVAGYCHFAKSALEEIDKDPELAPVFRTYALPLVSKVNFSSLGEWNRSHELQYRITSSDSDWPGVDFSFSPTFYFMKDGSLVHTVRGWASEGFLDDISEGVGKMLPGLKLNRKPAKKDEKPADKKTVRRRQPLPALGGLLKGLDQAKLHKFCSSIRFNKGVFSGAYMDDVREIFGDGRAEKLRAYLSGGAPLADPAGSVTFGELLSRLDADQLNRTCLTIMFHRGNFGGLRFGEIADVYGDKTVEKVFSYFSPPGTD